MTPPPRGRLYLITDSLRATRPLSRIVDEACVAGLRLVQFRDKRLEDEGYVEQARDLADIARAHGAQLLLNGRRHLVSVVGAAGVHLPSAEPVADARAELGDGALLGYSAHNAEELRRAAEEGADFVTLSPVFPTASKPGAPPVGLDRFRQMTSACALPVYALGGVTASNASACREAGAYGVAVSGAIVTASNPGGATAQLLEAAQ